MIIKTVIIDMDIQGHTCIHGDVMTFVSLQSFKILFHFYFQNHKLIHQLCQSYYEAA